MRYLSWAVLYEGHSDALYFDALLPRVISDIVAREARETIEVPDGPAVKLGREGRSISAVVKEACASREAFEVIFVHADTGGRALEQGVGARADAYCHELNSECDWPTERCVTITPRHETEAWLLADATAVAGALGYAGSPQDLGLPLGARDAERLQDPKRALAGALEQISQRRRAHHLETLFSSIAQRQELQILRQSRSFSDFEGRLRHSLKALRYLPT